MKDNRRHFLKKLSLAGAGIGVAATGYAAPKRDSKKDPKSKITWRLQTHASSHLAQVVIKPAIDAFNRVAGGEMSIELLHERDHVSGGDLYHALKDGHLDLIQTDDESIFPETEISAFNHYFPFACRYPLDVPALFKHWGLDSIWVETYSKVKGVIWLGAGAWDPCHLITKEPILSSDDLSGLKIFAPPHTENFFSRLGIKVVGDMPRNKIAHELAYGDNLDGIALSGMSEAYIQGYAGPARYFLSNSISGARWGSYFANLQRWHQLSDRLKGLFYLAMDSSHYYRQHWSWNREARLRNEEEKLQVTTISEQDWRSVRAEGHAFWEEVAERSARAREVVTILRKYNQMLDQVSAPYSCDPVNPPVPEKDKDEK